MLQVSAGIQTDEALAEVVGFLEACRDRMADVIEAGTQGLLNEELLAKCFRANDAIFRTLDAEKVNYETREYAAHLMHYIVLEYYLYCWYAVRPQHTLTILLSNTRMIFTQSGTSIPVDCEEDDMKTSATADLLSFDDASSNKKPAAVKAAMVKPSSASIQ